MERTELLAAAGLGTDELDHPDGRIPIARYCDLWKAIIERAPEDTIGARLGSTYRIREAGLVGYAMLHSRTLGEVIRRFIAYGRIIDDSAFVSMATVDGRLYLTVEEPPRLQGFRQPIEYDLCIEPWTHHLVVGLTLRLGGS